MKYCYTDQGLGYKDVPDDYVAQDGEVVFDEPATTEQIVAVFPKYETLVEIRSLKYQITNIEDSEQSKRAVREAVLTGDLTKLQEIESQIVSIRTQIDTLQTEV